MIKTFGEKKLTVDGLSKKDLASAKEFLDFINTLVQEPAMLLVNKKLTLKDEKSFLESNIKGVKGGEKIFLILRDGKKIVGNSSIERGVYSRNHVGKLGIAIADGYRGMGLGKYLISELIKLSKKQFGSGLKIVQLEVYAINKPAIGLYKKMGFKQAGRLPKQVQYKGKLIDELIMIKYL